MRRWLLLGALVLAALPATGGSATSARPTAAAVAVAPVPADRPVMANDHWLTVVNFYRATANLVRLIENKSWSEGGWLHGRYMVANRVIGHDETPGRAFYSAAGDAAANNGNVFLGSGIHFSDRRIIEGWMTGPFHAAGMIDPNLRVTGYGAYRSGGSTGATLDVLRGTAGYGPPGSAVVWPGNGMQVPVVGYSGGEFPDPISFCPGYPQASGLPILALLPLGVRATASSISRAGAGVQHCRFDSSSPGDGYGRQVLASRNTVVLMPRARLDVYVPYTVTLATTAGTLTWTFTAGEVEPPTVSLGGPTLAQPIQSATTIPLQWSGTDRHSGIASYDVRVREIALGSGAQSARLWQDATTATSATFTGTPGTTYCFSARAADKAGNRSPWTPERCTTLPVAALDLVASPLLWLPSADPAYYATTARMALTPGSTLSLDATKVRRIAVLVSTGAGNGSIDVSFNGTKVGTVDLSGATEHRKLVTVKQFANAYDGTVTITATSALTPVVVEGLGVSDR